MMTERNTFSVVFFCKKAKVTKKGKAPICKNSRKKRPRKLKLSWATY